MRSVIQIIEKPDWVSWDVIHQVLVKAHERNRQNGIEMKRPYLPGEEIAKEIAKDGVMLVAVDGNKVVGTAAILMKQSNAWYNKGPYGYLCFAAVLPEYSGKGIYRKLCEERESIAKKKGIDKLSFNTHVKNTSVININLNNGFVRVGAKDCGNHWNVIMFKWLNGSPFSAFTCHCHFLYSVLLVRLYRFRRSIIRKTK